MVALRHHPTDPGYSVLRRCFAVLIDFVRLSAVGVGVWLVGLAIQLELLWDSGSLFAMAGLSGSPYGSTPLHVWLGTILVRLGVWTVIGGAVFGYVRALDAGGQTFGKRQLGAVVTMRVGSAPGTTATALRTTVPLLPLPVVAGASISLGFLSFLLAPGLIFLRLMVEFLVLVFSNGALRLGDRLGGTVVVVTEEVAEKDPVVPAWADGDADTAGVD